jgi:hypothetical protein
MNYGGSGNGNQVINTFAGNEMDMVGESSRDEGEYGKFLEFITAEKVEEG